MTATSLRLPRGGVPAVVVRRSAGVFAFPLVLVMEVINALSRDRAWAMEFSGTINWSGNAVILAAPVIAGAAAGESVILCRRGGAELLRACHGRLPWVHAARVAAIAGWASIGHVVGVCLCLVLYLRVHDWSLASAPDLSLIPILPSLALLWAAAGLGSLAGWLWPRLLTPLLAAAGFYGIWMFLVLRGGRTLVLTGGTAPTPIGFRHRPSLIAAQVVWFAVLAATAVVAHLRPAGRTRVTVAAVSAVLVLGSGAAVKSLGSDVFEAVPGATASWVCRGSGPQVCVTAEYGVRLAAFDTAVRPVVTGLERLGVSAPARVEQRLDPRYQTAGAMPVAMASGGEVDAQQAVFNAVLWVSGCTDADLDRAGDSWFDTEMRLAGWLTGTYTGDATGATAVRTAGPDQARNWLQQLRTCG